jgi:hypothetical protein
VHVKTTLKKAIFMMKVFPYTETQNFNIVSPRKILVLSKLQMEKVFYSDHYYVDIFYDFDEQLDPITGLPNTTVTIRTDLVFVKKVALIQKKIQDYYDENMLDSFNKYLKPQLELWIEEEVVLPRQEKQIMAQSVRDVQPPPAKNPREQPKRPNIG